MVYTVQPGIGAEYLKTGSFTTDTDILGHKGQVCRKVVMLRIWGHKMELTFLA